MKCIVVVVRPLLIARRNITGHLDPVRNILRPLFALVVDVLCYRKAPNAER
jgi:hypothetical protein